MIHGHFNMRLANTERAKGRSILKAVPALKENHSVAVSPAQYQWKKLQAPDFGTEFVQFSQEHFLVRQQYLHPHSTCFQELSNGDCQELTLVLTHNLSSMLTSRTGGAMQFPIRVANWRSASNRAIPTVVARFRLRTQLSSIGIRTTCSQWVSSNSRGRPLVSEPNTRQSPGQNGKS